jgi:hypothetical protein
MSNSFLNKYGEWAVVTGASDGIGRSIALELAKKGLNLVIVARRESLLMKLEDEIKSMTRVQVKTLALDLTQEGATPQLMQEIQGLNVGLFAGVAGFGTSGDFIRSDLSNELNMFDLNCRSVVEQTFYFAKEFASKKRGGIILMGSLVGFQGTPMSANYAATKAFVQTFAEGIYYELKPLGVDVLVSAPGPVASGFSHRARMKMGLAATPEEVARGTIHALGRGLTVRPGFISKFLGWSLMMLPRGLRVRVMGLIMGGMTQHQINDR